MPRLLVVNNLPTYYRTPTYLALANEWMARGGREPLVVYQARRDPGRRDDWFFTPDSEFGFAHRFLTQNTWTSADDRTWYLPRFGVGVLLSVRPTHVLVSGWETPCAVLAAVFCRLSGAQLTMWVESTSTTSAMKGEVAMKFRRFLLRPADLIVAPTAMSAMYACVIANKPIRSVVLPNPVDLDRLPETVRIGRRLIFIGDFTLRKGFDRFLKILGALESYGWCGDAWGKDKENLAAQAPANLCVHLPLPLREIVANLDGNDIWVIPSRIDPAPLTFSEALALGLRCVLSKDLPYADDWIDGDGMTAVDCDEIEDIATRFEELLRSNRPPRRYAQLASNRHWAKVVVDRILE